MLALSKPARLFRHLVIFASVTLIGCTETIPIDNGFEAPVFDTTKFSEASSRNGALLYDDWRTLVSAPPTERNPVWSESDNRSSISNAETWRCSTCHGWDYKGNLGAFGERSNSYYTGFTGLYNSARNKSPQELFDFLAAGETGRGNSHAFAKYLDEDHLYNLVRFITTDVAVGLGNVIDNGTVAEGEKIFTGQSGNQRSCNGSGCHSTTNMKNRAFTKAVTNPEEFIHIVRYGNAGSSPAMPGGLSLNQAKDALAYVATLSGDVTESFSATEYQSQADYRTGGLLYDKWWKVDSTAAEPTSTISFWPAGNANTEGSATWRCKECHGWDYQGADGAYGLAQSSHYTTVKGLIGLTRGGGATTELAAAEAIFNVISNGNGAGQNAHVFAPYLSKASIYSLTKFIVNLNIEAGRYTFNSTDTTRGMGTTADFVELETGKIKPDSATVGYTRDLARGNNLYSAATGSGNTISNCASSACHAQDGARKFDPAQDWTVDSVAKKNPWEFIHKARFGHPGSSMPGLVQAPASVNIALAADLTAHSQSWLNPDVKRGGRLYDKWYSEKKVDTTAITWDDHLKWSLGTPSTANTTNGLGTWRCKECHGWDYAGVDGAYGRTTTGSHYTGIRSILTSALDQPGAADEVDISHQMGDPISNSLGQSINGFDIQDLSDIATFVAGSDTNEGIFDMTSIINLDTKAAINVSAAAISAGATLYTDRCTSCHGTNGKTIPIKQDAAGNELGLFYLSADNPWETVHKMINGQPNSEMNPPAYEYVTRTQAAQVLAYMQDQNAQNPPPGGGGGTTGPASWDNASAVSGGLLYDKWWKYIAPGSSSPVGVGNEVTTGAMPGVPESTVTAGEPLPNPHFLLRSGGVLPTGLAPDKTWRCKQCHGWDNKGRSGEGTGTSALLTITKGLHEIAALYKQATSELQRIDFRQSVYDRITSGFSVSGQSYHNFGPSTAGGMGLLSDQHAWDLTKYILEGQFALNSLDISFFVRNEGVDVNGTVWSVNGDPSSGLNLFRTPNIPDPTDTRTYCSECHGTLGDAVDGIELLLGDLTRSNPFEVVHKIRYGHPGSRMPAGYDQGLTEQDALDITKYMYDELQPLPAQGVQVEPVPTTTPTPTPTPVDDDD